MQKRVCMVSLKMMIAVLSLIKKDRRRSNEREKCKRKSGSVTISFHLGDFSWSVIFWTLFLLWFFCVLWFVFFYFLIVVFNTKFTFLLGTH